MTYVIGVSKVMDKSVIDLMSDGYCLGILILVRLSLLFGEMFMWHSSIMSLCHFVICTLCANCVLSSAHCVQIVCVLLVNVSVCQCHFLSCQYVVWPLHAMSLCPMSYGHCHAMANQLWVVFMCELILDWCCGQVIFVFMQPIWGCLHIFGQCVVRVVLFFRLKMSTLVCEVMKVYVVKMSPVKLGLYVQCEGYLLHLWWF